LSLLKHYTKVTKAVTDEDGMVNADFNELTQEAYKLSGFKIKYEAVMGKLLTQMLKCITMKLEQ
jgi:hypothetical protein